MTKAIFKDRALQTKFERNGYVIVPWLTDAEVKEVKQLYDKVLNETHDQFYSTSFSADDEMKRLVNAEVEKIYVNKVEAYCDQITKLGSSFLVKPTGKDQIMPVHQDWTIVDEKKYNSVTIWVPLQDVNSKNGAIKVLPGSHRVTDTIRCPSLESEYEGLKSSIWAEMIDLPMQAGEAFIFDHALLHASSSNESGIDRVAVTYGIVPSDATLYLYHHVPSGKMEKYEMPDDMFLRYTNIGQRPEIGIKVDEFDYDVPSVTEQRLKNILKASKMRSSQIPLFRDPAVQEQFQKDGYVKLSVLDEKEITELLNYYASLNMQDEAGFGFHISMDQQDKDFVRGVTKKIFDVALPKAAPHFNNAKAFVSSFVIKESNPTGIVPVHQDWTFVEDEVNHCSVTCWIPLQDVNIDNGALGVIKGSHRYFTNERPSPSPQVPSPLAEQMFTIFPYLDIIDMKAGEALVFDNRTFHGSPPNTSGKPRIAFGMGFTQQEATLCHYYLKPNADKKTILKYKIDPDFFFKYENAKLSKMYDQGLLIEGYEVAGESPYIIPKLSSDELTSMVKEDGNVFNVPLAEKMAKLFNYNMDGTKNEDKPQAPLANETKNTNSDNQSGGKPEEHVWVDNRTFFQKYTPANILAEIKMRLFSKA